MTIPTIMNRVDMLLAEGTLPQPQHHPRTIPDEGGRAWVVLDYGARASWSTIRQALDGARTAGLVTEESVAYLEDGILLVAEPAARGGDQNGLAA